MYRIQQPPNENQSTILKEVLNMDNCFFKQNFAEHYGLIQALTLKRYACNLSTLLTLNTNSFCIAKNYFTRTEVMVPFTTSWLAHIGTSGPNRIWGVGNQLAFGHTTTTNTW